MWVAERQQGMQDPSLEGQPWGQQHCMQQRQFGTVPVLLGALLACVLYQHLFFCIQQYQQYIKGIAGLLPAAKGQKYLLILTGHPFASNIFLQ